MNHLCQKLSENKNKIENIDKWEKAKKISNPYEFVYIPSQKSDSIANYQPISRSFFKMHEILHEFDLGFSETKKNIVLCLAEGPGGFMEAINNFRKNKDHIIGFTLQPSQHYIPNWKFPKNSNFDLFYGNLYQTKYINHLRDHLKDISLSRNYGANIVTADGGFDFSADFNNQEKMCYRILLAEILFAISLQCKNGTFICKCFDLFSNFTLKLVYLVYLSYEKFTIYKPKTSRLANSEKYIIATGFKGLNENYMERLEYILNNWEKMEKEDKNFDTCLNFIQIDDLFYKKIYNYNVVFVNNQIQNIEKTINNSNNSVSNNLYKTYINNQVINAINWCNKYNIPINEKSKYFKLG